jgi:c-di-GMP-binding flagellar brake protein YcgR
MKIEKRSKLTAKREVKPPPLDRRADNRVSEEDKVSIEILSGENPSAELPAITALTKDISPGGVRIMSSVKLEAGTRVRLEVVLSARRQMIKVNGVVRWWRNVYEEDLFEMGVEFAGLSPEDRLSLLEHVYRRLD